MKISILVFGVAQDILGTHILELEVGIETTNVGQLKALLVKRYPRLLVIPSFFISVNTVYASDEIKIKNGDEIAIIPPTSGG